MEAIGRIFKQDGNQDAAVESAMRWHSNGTDAMRAISLHPPLQIAHRNRLSKRRNNQMFRAALYIFGISAIAAAWVAYRDQKKARRPVPVQLAAVKLQRAWADHHTRV